MKEKITCNHLLKRIAACTRSGVVPGIDLRRFTEALNDPTTGLTYTALTGQHKQSVPDCERLHTKNIQTTPQLMSTGIKQIH